MVQDIRSFEDEGEIGSPQVSSAVCYMGLVEQLRKMREKCTCTCVYVFSWGF